MVSDRKSAFSLNAELRWAERAAVKRAGAFRWVARQSHRQGCSRDRDPFLENGSPTLMGWASAADAVVDFGYSPAPSGQKLASARGFPGFGARILVQRLCPCREAAQQRGPSVEYGWSRVADHHVHTL